MSDKYRRIEKPLETLPLNEIRVHPSVGLGVYLKRAVDFFNETENKTGFVIIKGVTSSLESAVKLGELIKHRVKGLHQINKITNIIIDDEYEPLEEGLDHLKITRDVAMLEIKLSKEPLDANDIGYQAPIDESEVLTNERFKGGIMRRGPRYPQPGVQLSRIAGIIEDVRLDGISRQLNEEAIVWGMMIATASQLVSILNREGVTLSKVINILGERKFDPMINVYSQVRSIFFELHKAQDRYTQSPGGEMQPPLKSSPRLATEEEAKIHPQASQIPSKPQLMPRCKICNEVLELRQQLKIQGCGHIVCIDCQRESINSNISKTSEHKCIQCPRNSAQVLSMREVERILLDEMLKKQDLLMFEKSGMKQCPTPNCRGKGIVEDNQIYCQICDKLFCGTCFGVLEFGHTCDGLLEQQLKQMVKDGDAEVPRL